MSTVITFNGTTYNSIDDMPPDVRRVYEKLQGVLYDKNQDGVPDALEGLLGSGTVTPLGAGQATVVYNGQVYHGLDQMPPEARAKYEKFQAQFDQNRNGIPDAVEGLLGGLTAMPGAPANASATEAAAQAAAAPAFASSAPIAPSAPSPYNQAAGSVVSPEGGDNRLRLALLAVVALGAVVCALAVIAIWAFTR